MKPAAHREDPLSSIIDPEGFENKSVSKVLHAARTHLGMDVAFVSEFRSSDRVFRYVDNGEDKPVLSAGDTLPLSEGYCQKVVDGRLPELIPDAQVLPAALEIPATRELPIGAHLSVPIRLSDGRLYGTFCCFSFQADTTLNERDLGMMRTLAEVIAYQVEQEEQQRRQRTEIVERLRQAMSQGQPNMVYQPIFDTGRGTVAGIECLSRFKAQPVRTPDLWFNEAAAVGLGVELELLAISTAVAELSTVPGDFYVGINSSPQTLFSGQLGTALDGFPWERLVLEITEHEYVDNYEALLAVLTPLRERGARIAIDDAGAGYSSLRHILCIQPELIKLDISLTQAIDHDPMRYALASALVEFARHAGSTIIAEGVETEAELKALYELGVRRIQGYHLSPPLSLGDLRALLGRDADAAPARQRATAGSASSV